jgi:predicted enzyme related to lactoylglutathione lyase
MPLMDMYNAIYSFLLIKGVNMPNPVLHFEIMAKGDRKKSQEFYSQLFDWHVDDDNPMNYGVVDTHSEEAEEIDFLRQEPVADPHQH